MSGQDDDLLALARKACSGDAKAFEWFCHKWKMAFRTQRNLLASLMDEMYEYVDAENCGDWKHFCEPHVKMWPRVGKVRLAQLASVEFGTFERCLVCRLAVCHICDDEMVPTEARWTDSMRSVKYYRVTCSRCMEER